MPEGDTIHYAARRIRPVLEGHVPDELATPHPRFARDRWPERLAGRAVRSVDAHGKHLFLRFEGGLTIHSHLRMTGSWRVFAPGRRWPRPPRAAWLVLRRAGAEVVQFNGPVLELMTDSRTRFDRRIAASGRTSSPPSSTTSATCGGCARTTRRGRSATPCSSSARSPGSATCGRSRRASRPASTPGGRPARSATRRRWRSSTPPARACSSPRATATRRATGASTAAPGCPARAAAAPR